MGMLKTCKETSGLVTQSLDRSLNFRERVGMRLHLMICTNCRRFNQQMHLIRAWLRNEDEASMQSGLSEQGRERIARNLQKEE